MSGATQDDNAKISKEIVTITRSNHVQVVILVHASTRKISDGEPRELWGSEGLFSAEPLAGGRCISNPHREPSNAFKML